MVMKNVNVSAECSGITSVKGDRLSGVQSEMQDSAPDVHMLILSRAHHVKLKLLSFFPGKGGLHCHSVFLKHLQS